MNAIKCLVACVALFSGAAYNSVSAASDPLSQANRLPPSLEQKVRDFQGALKMGGYEVARGYWDLWAAEDCKLPLQTIGSCYGNNPTAPYVLAFVPYWNDEFVDWRLNHTLAQGQRRMTPYYRLGEREAVVVMAELPPPARYFGIGTNVFTRLEKLNTNDAVFQKLNYPELDELRTIIFGGTPNPDRRLLVASIGDSINNVVIEEQSKENWGQQRFFAITPDADMAEAMKSELTALGVDESHVFTERVSPELVRLGYGPAADDLFTYIRYSVPNDAVLGEQWRAQLPLTVLRVRDPKGGSAKEPFPIPEYEAKVANTDERSEFKEELASLAEAVKDYWEPLSADETDFRSLSLWVDLIGQHCLGHDGLPAPDPAEFPPDGDILPRGPMNCLGDSQDADYQISGGTYTLDGDEVIAIVGTLGTKTGNATYSSLSVNWFPELVGVINRDDTVLEESAKKFKDAFSDPELYKKFYVYYFARDCSGLYPWCQEVSRSLIPAGDRLKIVQRNYLNPGTRRGADPHMVLNPKSILFTGPKEDRPTM